MVAGTPTTTGRPTEQLFLDVGRIQTVPESRNDLDISAEVIGEPCKCRGTCRHAEPSHKCEVAMRTPVNGLPRSVNPADAGMRDRARRLTMHPPLGPVNIFFRTLGNKTDTDAPEYRRSLKDTASSVP